MVYNQVTSRFPKNRDDRVSDPNPMKERALVHQLKRQLVESVARSNKGIVLMGRIIILVVVKVDTRSRT